MITVDNVKKKQKNTNIENKFYIGKDYTNFLIDKSQ